MAVEGIRTGVVVLWEHGWHLRVCLSLSIWMEVSQLNMMDGELRQREGIGYLTSVSFSGQADPCSLCICDQLEQTLAGSAPLGDRGKAPYLPFPLCLWLTLASSLSLVFTFPPLVITITLVFFKKRFYF